MLYKAHVVGAVASGCGAVYLSNKIGLSTNAIYIVAGAAIGGLIPDIDHPDSFVGNVIEPISKIIKDTIGHRTLTHSLLFLFIISIVTSILNVNLGIGIGIGILSHILLDLFTPHTKGVAFLYPFYKRKIKLL